MNIVHCFCSHIFGNSHILTIVTTLQFWQLRCSLHSNCPVKDTVMTALMEPAFSMSCKRSYSGSSDMSLPWQPWLSLHNDSPRDFILFIFSFWQLCWRRWLDFCDHALNSESSDRGAIPDSSDGATILTATWCFYPDSSFGEKLWKLWSCFHLTALLVTHSDGFDGSSRLTFLLEPLFRQLWRICISFCQG